MKLSQIKTKEVRDRVRKSRYKKFIFAFIVLFLILIVSVCFHSYYAQQKAKKNATAKAQQKMENEYNKISSPTKMQYARYRDGLFRLFSTEYEKARASLKKVVQKFPSTEAKKTLDKILSIEKEVNR